MFGWLITLWLRGRGTKKSFTLRWHLHRLISFFFFVYLKWGNMKRNVNGSHSLKAKTRPRGGGPCSCSQGNPSMLQARLKAALSVNSKLFLLQTRNDNKKITSLDSGMWNTLLWQRKWLLEMLNMSFSRNVWCVGQVWRQETRSVCATKGKIVNRHETTEETLHAEDHDSQAEGSDVTRWVSRAVRIKKPWRSSDGGANQSQRSQSGGWNGQQDNHDLESVKGSRMRSKHWAGRQS